MKDLRYALRGLRKSPLFTVAALLSLTLGIATATTVFSLVNAAILRQPPFPEADRVMLLNTTQLTPGEPLFRTRWSWPRLQLLMKQATSFEAIASSSNNVLTLTGQGDPEPVAIELVSWRYHALLRAPIILGNGFTEAVESGFSPVIILGYDFWQRRFAGSPAVLGSVVQLNGVALTIVGIAERGFGGVSGLAQAWVPATMAPQVSYADYLTTNQNFITAIARLKPGVTIGAAQAEMDVLGRRLHAEIPHEADTPQDVFSAALMPLNGARVDVVTRRALLMLSGAVGLLLVIACANVASLLLGRAEGRRREIAIRLAVGADRGRLVRLLLVESAVLAGGAGLLGTLLTAWTLMAVRIPTTLARGRNFYGAVGEFATPGMDWRVITFVVLVCAASVLVFGLIPALRATRADLVTDLKVGGERKGPGGVGLREVIVALQLALAVMLVVGCGLLLTSFSRMRAQPLGFDPERLLTFGLRPSEVQYPTEAAPALLDRVLEEIRRVPGVEGATVDGCVPLAMQCANAQLFIVAKPWVREGDAPSVLRHYVAPTHFTTLGIPIVRGRGLTPDDRPGRPKVVVINQKAADRFWPGQDPIGQRVWWNGAAAFGEPDSAAEIVGIVGDVAHQPLDERPVQPDFFTAYAQFTYPNRMVMVRARGEPEALIRPIAQAIQRADPGLALFDVQTMEQRARLSWSKRTGQTAVFSTIAAIALLLAITGVYAVTASFVASRLRDIGVRMALGAPRSRIVSASLSHTIRLGVLGVLAGLAGAVATSRLLRAALYDTSPLAIGVYLATAGVLVLALVLASYLPVRRALAVSPADVLRSE
jgi:putative ABC transport system permease protein